MTSVSSDRRQGLNSGMAVKIPVKAATTANIVLSGLQTIDGVACVAGDRVLVKNQTTSSQNGIYDVDSGNWTRSLDFDGPYDLTQGSLVYCNQGGANAATWFIQQTASPTIGTSNLVFTQFAVSTSMNVLNTIAALRANGAGMATVEVLGYHSAGDGGGGFFRWNAADASQDDGGTIIQLNAGGVGRFNRINYTKLTAKHFGALGDGTGNTPTDTGDDISAAPWNTWDNNLLKTYGSGPFWEGVGSAVFAPPTVTPFLNTDSWDRIGIQLLLWSSAKTVHIPDGTYLVNLTVPGHLNDPAGRYYDPTAATGIDTSFTGFILGPQQYKIVRGDGWYHTYIRPKEDAAFFASAAGHVGVPWAYSMMTCYKVNGLPTVFQDISIVSPPGYDKENKNLAAIILNSCNGITVKDCWPAALEYGVMAKGACSDIWVRDSTLEQIFGAGILSDATSIVMVDGCSFGSANLGTTRQLGIDATGAEIYVTNCRFWPLDTGAGSEGTRLGAIRAASGLFAGNNVKVVGTGECCVFTDRIAVTGNRIFGSSTSNAMMRVTKRGTVTGNNFWNANGGVHGILTLGDNTAGSAVDVTVTGNVFNHDDATVAADNYAIIAPQTGVDSVSGATASTYIGNNVFNGRALETIGAATMGPNIYTGVMETGAADKTATTAQLTDKTAAINTTNKYAGKMVRNTTTNLLLYAIGSAATDHWYSAAGADTHTPV